MLRVLTFLLFLFFPASVCILFAQSFSDPNQIATLAARGNVGALRPLYEQQRTKLSPGLDLFCQLAFRRADGELSEVATIIEQLEYKHENMFDVGGLLALADERCSALLAMGEYAELHAYASRRLDWANRRGIKSARQTTLRSHHSLARQFLSQSQPTVEWGTMQFELPLTRDWPLLIPASINHNEEVPFLISTEHLHTYISAADAEQWGVRPMSIPFSVKTTDGISNAQPAIVPELRVGAVTFRNLLVFVLSDEVDAPHNRALGTWVLQQMQTLTFSERSLRIAKSIAQQSSETYALTFAVDGGLFLQRLNTATTQSPTPLTLGEDEVHRDAPLANAFTTVFVRGAKETMFDFNRHLCYRVTPIAYQPQNLQYYLAKSDYFGLLRNESALTFTLSPEEQAQMTTVLNACLDPSYPVVLPRGLEQQPSLQVQQSEEMLQVAFDTAHPSCLLSKVGERSLAVELNPLHPLSQISRTAAVTNGFPLVKDAKGRWWAQIPELHVGTLTVSNLLCWVNQSSNVQLILGLDVLTRAKRIAFHDKFILFQPASKEGTSKSYLVAPAGLVLEDDTNPNSSTRALRRSDFEGKIFDFPQMAIE